MLEILDKPSTAVELARGEWAKALGWYQHAYWAVRRKAVIQNGMAVHGTSSVRSGCSFCAGPVVQYFTSLSCVIIYMSQFCSMRYDLMARVSCFVQVCILVTSTRDRM